MVLFLQVAGSKIDLHETCRAWGSDALFPVYLCYVWNGVCKWQESVKLLLNTALFRFTGKVMKVKETASSGCVKMMRAGERIQTEQFSVFSSPCSHHRSMIHSLGGWPGIGIGCPWSCFYLLFYLSLQVRRPHLTFGRATLPLNSEDGRKKAHLDLKIFKCSLRSISLRSFLKNFFSLPFGNYFLLYSGICGLMKAYRYVYI